MNVARRRRQSCLTQNNLLIWIWIRFLPKWQNSNSFYKIAILEAVEYLWSLEKQQIPPSSWSEMKMHLAFSEQDLPNSKEGVYVQWEESGRTQLFIQDSRVFTCAIHSFIQGCLLSMVSVSEIQSSSHQKDTPATLLKIKWTGSDTLPLMICFSGTEPSEKIQVHWLQTPITLHVFVLCFCLFVCLASKKYKMWEKLTYWWRT